MKAYKAEIPCPDNNEGCRYFPNCTMSLHHEVPRRLLGMAVELDMGDIYQSKLKKVINHPSTHIFCCRNIHDLLDRTLGDDLPPEDKLDSQINGF